MQAQDFEDNDPYAFDESKPSWICQHCGHEDTTKPMPKDREKYYRNPWEAKCPACKGKCMMPSGF